MTDPQQPGLRSYIVYDEPPAGCIVFENVRASVGCHVHTGEYVVIDPSDSDPMHGELFLIQWSTGAQELAETRLREGRYGVGPNGESELCSLWWIEVTQRMVGLLSGRASGPTRWGDGPYREQHVREKLIGRVVGIYQPDFRTALERRAA
ncbi:hypothetical protein GS397_00840 [Sphingobium yanoikuyae]|uniref:Uncharacterized protein n=1 Tax=Sphingobium yanoikuyae TaxID=13690 RepID=A0A6P1GB85_SPHYA|nr:hypothetical protein [Sphingobium yanoikuyae]QHD65757.1 hypothetical protein GS397_00840 [Sphingobium yanoikuyae]